jgi:hypothetical protein
VGDCAGWTVADGAAEWKVIEGCFAAETMRALAEQRSWMLATPPAPLLNYDEC